MPRRYQTRQEAVNGAYAFLLRQKLSPAEKEGFARLNANPIPALAKELGSSESWASQLVGDLRKNKLYEFVQGKNGDSNHWLLKLPEGNSEQLKLPGAQPSSPPEEAPATPPWVGEFDRAVEQIVAVLTAARDKLHETAKEVDQQKETIARLEQERDTALAERDQAAEASRRLSDKLKAVQAFLNSE